LQVFRIVPLEPSIEGKSRELCFSQPVGVVVEPVAIGDAVVIYFLSDGEDSYVASYHRIWHVPRCVGDDPKDFGLKSFQDIDIGV
jgi:hypothetical protein